MESSAEAIRKIDDSMLDDLLCVNNCMLHGHSKPLELAWLEFFGKFEIGEPTVSQLVYNLWVIQDRLREFFRVVWQTLVGEEWEGPLLCKCNCRIGDTPSKHVQWLIRYTTNGNSSSLNSSKPNPAHQHWEKPS